MTSETKVILITSDEDTIRQVKPNKTRKKSTDLICTICADRAIGYNYAVLSCASCKAFFHRTGHEDSKRFKCLTGLGQCIIDHKISRKCYRCRLKRCLAMGMRRDLLLSQQEIQRRKDAGRNRKSNVRVSQSIVEELEMIRKIESSFLSIFGDDCDESTDPIDPSDRTSQLICCLQFNNEAALRLIRFCRLIDQFESSDADDRFIMIKYNLLLVLCILTCYRPNQIDESATDREREEEEEARRQIYVLCNQSDHLFELFLYMGSTFHEIIDQDWALLSLLLLICLFSKGLSTNENEPTLKDPISVYHAQSYYTQLLWNYMIHKHGETKTCKHWIQLLMAIFRAQSAAVKYRQVLGEQVRTLDAVDEIAPLMQTILHIS